MRMLSLVVGFVLAVVLYACGWASAQSTPLHLLIYGDSLTAWSNQQGFTTRVFDQTLASTWPGLLHLSRPDVVISEQSNGGATCGELSKRFSGIGAKFPADSVVIECGTNDVLENVPPHQTLSDVLALMDAKPKARYIVILPPARFRPLEPAGWDASIAAVRSVFLSLQSSRPGYQIVVIDPLGVTDWQCSPDDPHLCANGHKAMADSVLSMIGVAR